MACALEKDPINQLEENLECTVCLERLNDPRTLAEETNQYVENIKRSVQLSKKLVDQGTDEEIISSQKRMLENVNNLLANREEYFKSPVPAVM